VFDDGDALLEAVCRSRLEGVVAKTALAGVPTG